MAHSLRRNQHLQRKEEYKASSEAGIKTLNTVTLFPAPARPTNIARDTHWTPWVLDSKGTYYWSALRRADGNSHKPLRPYTCALMY